MKGYSEYQNVSLENGMTDFPWRSVSPRLLPRLCPLPPTGSTADPAAWPHAVRSGQAPRGMTSYLQMNLKAVAMRRGRNMLPLEPCQIKSEHCEN